MNKRTGSDAIKALLVETSGGSAQDWKRTSKSKNGKGQVVRDFTNAALAKSVSVVEEAPGQYRIDTPNTAPAQVSPAALQTVANYFQDLINQTLDDLMQGDADMVAGLAESYLEAHIFAARDDKDLATAAVDSLRGASIQVKDLVMEDDPFTKEEVLAKLATAGFRTAGETIYYDHPLLGVEKPAPAPAPAPTKTQEVLDYAENGFIGNIVEARDLEDFEVQLDEYNTQNAYNGSSDDYTPQDLTLGDFRGLSIKSLFASDRDAQRFYKVEDFTDKLKAFGFIVNGDAIEGHKSARPQTPTAGKAPAP